MSLAEQIRARLDSLKPVPGRAEPRKSLFKVKDFIAAGGCMHRLRTRIAVDGEEDKPWTVRYYERDLPCSGTLHKGGTHLYTTINGRSVAVHQTKGGHRWL